MDLPAYGSMKAYSLVSFPFDMYDPVELQHFLESSLGPMGPQNWVMYSYGKKEGQDQYLLPSEVSLHHPTNSWWVAVVES